MPPGEWEDADFELLEGLRLEASGHYFLLARHLDRLESSARELGFAFERGRAEGSLASLAEQLPGAARKVRLRLRRSGELVLEPEPLGSQAPARVALAREPVASDDPRLRHKSSRREPYERARAGWPGCDDVLLWNERGELTESCSANLVLELGGRRLTPPLESGLLPGTFRAHLLERGEIEEAVLPRERLAQASRLYLVNSVRHWRPALRVADEGGPAAEIAAERPPPTRR